MSTQKPGSPDGTPDQSITIGLVEWVRLRRELFALATTLNEIKSRTHYVEQTVQSLESSVGALMDQVLSIDTPEESTSEDSSSITDPFTRALRSSYVRGQWTLSPSGEWEYEHSQSTEPDSPQPKSDSSTDSTPTMSTQPSTPMKPGGEPTAQQPRHSIIGWCTESLGRSHGARMWMTYNAQEDWQI